MDAFSLFGIAVGLAMDAFAVSVANGAANKRMTLPEVFRVAGCFAVFQGIMPLLGWLVGKAGERLIASVDHWIALILLAFLGAKMIWDSCRQSCENPQSPKNLTVKTLLAMALATSIDALATGIILPAAVGADTCGQMLLAVLVIAGITFILCLFGVFLGKKFGCLLHGKAGILGGAVLIAIGIKIFVQQMFF